MSTMYVRDKDGNLAVVPMFIGSGGAVGEMDQLNMLIETDMLPAVYNEDKKILTDENGKIVLRY